MAPYASGSGPLFLLRVLIHGVPHFQFIVIKTRLVELKGRKVTVTGTIEDLDGNVLVEARYAVILAP